MARQEGNSPTDGTEDCPPGSGQLDRVRIQARISVARSTKKLDLSGAGLARIPSEVFKIKDLEELAINGNDFEEIPPEIASFKELRKLGAAGNRITHVASEIGELAELEGLWLHGNQLEEIPDSVGNLQELQILSLSGNKIENLPTSIGGMSSLVELTAAGNRMSEIPGQIGACSRLQEVHLHGNRLAGLPPEFCRCTQMKKLYLQGNNLTSLPSSIGSWGDLQELSLADNEIENLPEEWEGLKSLKDLYVYGNRLDSIPRSIKLSGSLQSLWAENNPFDGRNLKELVEGLGQLKSFGMDEEQAKVCGWNTWSSDDLKHVQVSEVHSGKFPGYFKLRRSNPDTRAPVLIVAFGSAPGVPNWGGLLGRLRKAMPEGHKDAFDVLFVVDPSRTWYEGHRSSSSHYGRIVREVATNYKRTILLGDSMGASACLLYAKLGSAILAFCPQVDLEYSSIRPGEGSQWFAQMHECICDSLTGHTGQVHIHTGSWEHDSYQAQLVRNFGAVEVTQHGIDSHRLALALHKQDKLLPIVKKCLEEQLATCSVGI